MGGNIMKAILAFSALVLATAVQADAPKFQVDPAWPKTLPNSWIMGQAAGVAVDAQDHIWVVQRPKTLTDDEKALTFDPPRTKCCRPAPPVMEFDQEGKLIQAWGGPGQGYDWPQNEHGIHIDHKGFVWLAANGEQDGHILKFTRDGKFVLQIGKPGPQTDSRDTTRLGRPAHMVVDPQTNEVFVADGYYNHRVIVFDADTGAYKRLWGAYG
jgi:DNA-binding beta-propeller fold protein YncE